MLKHFFLALAIMLAVCSNTFALAPWNLGTQRTGIHAPKTQKHTSLAEQLSTIAQNASEHNTGMMFEPSKPQLISNEPDREKLIATLSAQALDDNRHTCHVGVSGLFNYDMMAARKSGFAILLDINPNVIKVHKIVIELLKDMDIATRHDFMAKFMTRLRSDSVNLMVFDLRLFQALERQLEQEHTWLGTDEAFEHIRLLAIADRIVPIELSLADTKNLAAIAQAIRSADYRVDTLYTSNVIEWIMQASPRQEVENAKTAFAMALLPLIDQSSLYISSDNRLIWGFKLDINSPENNTFPILQNALALHQSA